jgi:two-component system chemotaxis sensor kinase CheA
MVRNSVDHGLERPDERERAGKSRAGRVELRARHQAGKVVIEIADDGKGLNRARILRKAIDNGLVRPDEQLTDQQVFQLIFAAGLSTAEKVTDVSGRGVGMDVVKRNVEALRGRIDITSVEGRGTTFSIQLPLTLAVIDGLVVRVGPERYIVPITSIEQSLRPTPDQVSTVQNRGEVCMVRGNLLTLFRLHKLFDVTPASEDPAQALVVIVQDHNRRCCLLVDEVLGQQQVVIKSLGDGIGEVPGVSGGAILGDGSVSLILDVPGVIDLAVRS